MRKVNLKSYPKFWTDFTDRVNKNIDPSMPISGSLIKIWIKDWYGLNLYITSNGAFAEVHMHDAEYTAFLLRWS